MKEKDFKDTRSGKLVKTPEGVLAFVPDPLPPKGLFPSWELMRLNSEADRALAELSGLARILPNAHLLSGSFRRREAVLSSRIEGTVTTISELFLFEAGAPIDDNTADVREVSSYVNALDFGLNALAKLPVCNRLIRDVHRVLMTGVRGKDKTPGEFRTQQNYIGATTATKIQDATYVPPPVSDMTRCMQDLEEFINGHSELPPLVRQALIHYQFEAIHPFQDGNGRIGRLLLTLDLCAEKIVEHPLLYISEYFERRRDEYYSLLFAISSEGAWDTWIRFFLEAVIHQARDAQERAKELHDLMQDYRRRLIEIRATASALRVMEELFFIPVINTVRVTQLAGGQTKTGKLAIDKLVKAGILKEFSSKRQRNRIYIAEGILQKVTG